MRQPYFEAIEAEFYKALLPAYEKSGLGEVLLRKVRAVKDTQAYIVVASWVPLSSVDYVLYEDMKPDPVGNNLMDLVGRMGQSLTERLLKEYALSTNLLALAAIKFEQFPQDNLEPLVNFLYHYLDVATKIESLPTEHL